MDKDQTIEIQRVGNGYIVRPGFNMSRGGESYLTSDQMVFETLDALSTWLTDHFQNRPRREGCESPRGVITTATDRRLLDK